MVSTRWHNIKYELKIFARGANVQCPDCKNVQPQTSTVNVATLTFSGEKKRDAAPPTVAPRSANYASKEEVDKAFEVALNRVNGYLGMSDDEFLARWDV